MDQAQKLKNIYDLNYSKELNYQNVWWVILGTLMVSIWLKEFKFNTLLSIIFKFLISSTIIIFAIALKKYFNNRLSVIESRIKAI